MFRMAIGEYLAKELNSPAFEPPELMRRMVEQGKLGKKQKRVLPLVNQPLPVLN